MDNSSNSSANTEYISFGKIYYYVIASALLIFLLWVEVNTNSRMRYITQVSDLSAMDGKVLVYRGGDG